MTQQPTTVTLDDDIYPMVARLSASLPSVIDLAPFGGVISPLVATQIREALIYRVEEVGRRAADAFGGGDFAVASILTRGVMEAASLTVFLAATIEQALKSFHLGKLQGRLESLAYGTRLKAPEGEKQPAVAINVLKCIDAVAKKHQRFRDHYDVLSELTHPNHAGVTGLYTKLDAPNLQIKLGRPTADRPLMKHTINGLAVCLELFIVHYEKVGALMPAFIAACQASVARGDAGADREQIG